MKCTSCKINIPAGSAAAKMIVEYQQPDGSTRFFGYQMPDGPLSAATGYILRGFHHKCFHALRKRAARALVDVPTCYEAGDTNDLDLDALRAVAHTVGKPIGDPEVNEAYKARQHGGPYPHTHDMPMDTYQTLAHLRHAHGLTASLPDPHFAHEHLHATAAALAINEARQDDPGHHEPPVHDWRTQSTTDVEHLAHKGDS